MRDDQKAHGLVETNSYRGGDWERIHVLVYECISVDFSCDPPSRGWKFVGRARLPMHGPDPLLDGCPG
jgi:hypothetical protein